MTSKEDLHSIVSKNVSDQALTRPIVEFVDWLQANVSIVVSIRDVLAWTSFTNTVTALGLGPGEALWGGAPLVWLDGLQVDGGVDSGSVLRVRGEARRQLARLTEIKGSDDKCPVSDEVNMLKVGPFSIAKGGDSQMSSTKSKYSFKSQTISQNIRKIIR